MGQIKADHRRDDPIHQAHDKIVKKLLSNPEVAKELLKLCLPKKLLALTDLESISVEPNDFIDNKLRVFTCDLLYKVKIRDEISYILVLLEHKSAPDPWLPVFVFVYMAMIWDRIRRYTEAQRKEGSKRRKREASAKIPFIYPLILYNGNKPYSHKLNLKEMIFPESIQPFFNDLFTKPFSILDLSVIDDETLEAKLKGHPVGQAFLMTLKHISDVNLNRFFETDLKHAYACLDQSGKMDELYDLLLYLFKKGKNLNRDHFFQWINEDLSQEVGKKMKTKYMTLEEQAIYRGRQKGIKEGRQKGIKEGRQEGIKEGRQEEKTRIAKYLLSKGLDPKVILNATKLTEVELGKLDNDDN